MVLSPFNDTLFKYIDHNIFIKEKSKEVPLAYIKLPKGLKTRRKHRILCPATGRKPKSINNIKLKETVLIFYNKTN